MAKKIFTISGMHCESCKKLIESELQDKVKSVSVNVDTGKAAIDFDPAKITEKEIKDIIIELGYKAWLLKGGKMKNKFIIGILIALTSIMYLSAAFGMMHHNNGMNKGYSNMNQVSGYNNNYNNMTINGFHANHLYVNHMKKSNMENNFDHMRYKSFRMMQMH